jgi:hypothetical protein
MYEQDKRIELMCSRVDFRVRVGWKVSGKRVALSSAGRQGEFMTWLKL